jgi:hypothetical protein
MAIGLLFFKPVAVATGNHVGKNVLIVTRLLICSRRNQRKEKLK